MIKKKKINKTENLTKHTTNTGFSRQFQNAYSTKSIEQFLESLLLTRKEISLNGAAYKSVMYILFKSSDHMFQNTWMAHEAMVGENETIEKVSFLCFRDVL